MEALMNINIDRLQDGNIQLYDMTNFLMYYQSSNTLGELNDYNKFIKSCEHAVRAHPRYKKYKAYLMNEIGLNFCQVFPNINVDASEDDNIIEMHHGPILTLYDITSIIVDHLRAENEKFTSFDIVKLVLDEHEHNNVQVVMLCENAHKAVHADKIYINPKQAWGNLHVFLEKYIGGLNPYNLNIIKTNLEIARKYNSTDMGFFDED